MTGRAMPAPGAHLVEDAPLGAMIEQEVLRAGLDRVLRAVRRHLGMDVAFIARFGDTDRVFEYVDADGAAPIAAGQSLSLQEGYCQKVVSGELPQCIPDTAVLPATREIPATVAVPIGAHMSVPISLESGAVYGTLCCFSYVPNPDLTARDMRLMHAFADVLAARIDEALAAGARSRGLHEEIRRALEGGAPRMVFQPIYRVGGGRPGVTGVEALARFDGEPLRGPDRWFETAEAVGLRHELELAAIAHALPALERLPRALFLALNVSPCLILSGRLGPALAGVPGERLMLEVTEHATIADYAALETALCPLRARGIRLAVDDAGAGFASMRHILNLAPDMIKLDISLTRGIDGDARRRALARGLVAFAHDIGCAIAAEGVETPAELDTLRGLGVDEAQGYLLDPPLGLDEVLRRRPAASAA
ncbi:EAL domain-containing protein [Ancylobacter sp. WKF20]|uniref:sensor domain-containing phosphodiesterase n=1 Tax=Ancylobacter sp. WKF20 TaxID=3039801 RepID=UPI00243445D2|nr:EAL domain-containing protein [Ancylobacter sp. WKF20]WGD29424.1 EAL domain-containing protein [Ancylobacter sp. WKF20]